MKIYNCNNGTKEAFVNNQKVTISENAANLLEHFSNWIETIAEENGIAVKKFTAISDADTLAAINTNNYTVYVGEQGNNTLVALFNNGKLVEFKANGTICEAPESEVKKFFGI